MYVKVLMINVMSKNLYTILNKWANWDYKKKNKEKWLVSFFNFKLLEKREEAKSIENK